MILRGSIPKTLKGQYIRNGPGDPGRSGPKPHYFDSDGLLHSVTFENGSIAFNKSFVQTEKFTSEELSGRYTHSGVFSLPLESNVSNFKPSNVSNTNVLSLNNRLYSLYEAGVPYEISPNLETIGKSTLDNLLEPHQPLSAHYRETPDRRAVVICSVMQDGLDSVVHVYEVQKDTGNAQQTSRFVVHNNPFPFFHDFVVTENYYIFVENPTRFDLRKMILEFPQKQCSIGECVTHKIAHPMKAHIICRRSGELFNRVSIGKGFVFHHMCAWESAHGLHWRSCVYPSMSFQGYDTLMQQPAYPMQYDLDLHTMQVERVALHAEPCEFPVHCTRDMSYMLGSSNGALYNCVVKINHKTNSCSLYTLPDGKVPHEPVFANDGHLMLFVGKDEFHIVNPDTMECVCVVNTPFDIPLGLHGTFVSG